MFQHPVSVKIILLIVSLFLMVGCERQPSGTPRSGSSTQERVGVIDFKGMPMTLVGPAIEVGQKAPDFTLADIDLKEHHLSDYAGKVIVLSIVPSLDTPICNQQTRRFNESAGELAEKGVVFLTISEDLPFAIKRWCTEESVDQTICLSDYHDRAFGKSYGVLIKELMLLSRTVIVVDREGVIRYIQRVKEQIHEPKYDEVLAAVGALL